MTGKKQNSQRKTALFALLTVAGMALFFNLYNPWIPVGPDRILDGGFENPSCIEEWTGWGERVSLTPQAGFQKTSGVQIRTTPTKNGILRKTITEIENVSAFQVSLRATTQNVQGGKESWYFPRSVFFYRTTENKALFNISHGIFMIDKDSHWKHYTETFPVPDHVKNVTLQVQNLGVGGILCIDDLSIIPVKRRASAPLFTLFFTLLWSAALLSNVITLRLWKTTWGIGVLLVAALILLGVLLPSQTLNQGIDATYSSAKKATQQIEQLVSKPDPQQKPTSLQKPETEEFIAKKEAEPIHYAHRLGHAALFMLLAMLSMLCWNAPSAPRRRPLFILAGLSLFAAATEIIQFITPDRTAKPPDFAIDLSGILLAVVLAQLATRYQRKAPAS